MNRSQTHKIRLLLVITTLIPIGVLAWLSVRTLQQEQDAELQRTRESLEVAAGRLALDIDREFAQIDEQLARGEGFQFKPEEIVAPKAHPLLYGQKYNSSFADAQPNLLFELARPEDSDLAAAATAYEKLTRSEDQGVRGGALLRLARVRRKQSDKAAAVKAYEALEKIGLYPIDGEPALLMAHQGKAKVFEERGDSEALRNEANTIARLLYSEGLPIDRATFEFYVDLLKKWGGPPPPVEAVARTEAAIAVWQDWRSGELPLRGRRLLREQGLPVVAVWEGQSVWLAAPDRLQDLLESAVDDKQLRVALLDPADTAGQPLLGTSFDSGVTLTPAETRLPFSVKVGIAGTPTPGTRNVLIAGLVMTLCLMIAAAWTLYRFTTRELMLARQQADFVSAVSHEFRTPLTSMRHLTDLLVSRGVHSEERREQYYALLANETERLHRMVESLLSFGRIEAGAYAWKRERTDIGELVESTVEEFRRDSLTSGRLIVCDVADGLPEASVDRAALSRALWNLMENALKYSDSEKPIRVHVRETQEMPHALLLAVEDEGAGIPASERETIFQKFVRGEDAKRGGVRGVGIGLALVRRIAEAHGGAVRVESELGRGSTFTLVIPCRES